MAEISSASLASAPGEEVSWIDGGVQGMWRRLMEQGGMEKYPLTHGTGYVVAAEKLPVEIAASSGLAGQVCDHRYYEVVGRSLPEFPLRYLALCDEGGMLAAIVPFFWVRQDILAGTRGMAWRMAERVRRIFPGFLTLRTLMVGNPVGSGSVGCVQEGSTAGRNPFWLTRAMGEAFDAIGRKRKARIVVFKDFPASTREMLEPLTSPAGRLDYARLPSMPMTRLGLKPYRNFEDFMQQGLSKVTRKGLRRKFRDAEGQALEMRVTNDVSDCVEEVYGLYLQVFSRAKLSFEKLTPEFFVELGRRMPERARFFLWRLGDAGGGKGRLVAVSATLANVDQPGVEKAIYDLYLGMDYPLALDLHLYFVTMRDVMDWAIGQGIETYYSTPLNYDSKLHLRHELAPLDLYVRHLNGFLNPMFKFAMRFAEPTRHDKILPKFSNAHQLKG